MKKLYSFLVFTIAFAFNSIAQCPTGQVNVTVDVMTDNWGYECFWDITPTGNGCGNGALFTFGNTAEVNCLSGGSQLAASGGYGDNITVTETIGCLQIGNCFDINYVDDYGDGGAIFVVKFKGVIMHTFSATDTTVTATYSFCVAEPPVYDASITTVGSKYKMLPLSQSSNVIAPAAIASSGTGTITGVKANVKVMKNAVQVYSVSTAPQSVPSLTNTTFSFSPYIANSFGEHTFNYSTQMNQVDEVLSNDTISFKVNITDTVYAIDDNDKFDLIGLGAGEKGYLGNLFQIIKPTQAKSVSVFMGDGTQVSGQSAVDSVFKVHIFNTNPVGIPTTILATTTGKIENVLEKWYTVSFASPVNLSIGQYMVAIEEEHHMHEIGYTLAYHPLTTYVSSVTQIPWAPVEDFGFPISFMIRLNLATSGLAVSKLENSDLTIYPNPVSNELTIGNTVRGAKVEIYNQLGQKVHSTETQNGSTKIDVQQLKNGLYTIKTIEENKIGFAKFIKE